MLYVVVTICFDGEPWSVDLIIFKEYIMNSSIIENFDTSAMFDRSSRYILSYFHILSKRITFTSSYLSLPIRFLIPRPCVKPICSDSMVNGTKLSYHSNYLLCIFTSTSKVCKRLQLSDKLCTCNYGSSSLPISCSFQILQGYILLAIKFVCMLDKPAQNVIIKLQLYWLFCRSVRNCLSDRRTDDR